MKVEVYSGSGDRQEVEAGQTLNAKAAAFVPEARAIAALELEFKLKLIHVNLSLRGPSQALGLVSEPQELHERPLEAPNVSHFLFKRPGDAAGGAFLSL